MSDKKRVDVALVERGLAQSREKAQALVMSGVVYIGENKVDKASMQVTPEDELIVRHTRAGSGVRAMSRRRSGRWRRSVRCSDWRSGCRRRSGRSCSSRRSPASGGVSWPGCDGGIV